MKKRDGKPRRGQSLVEFTLVLPLILLIFAGVTELGFILNDYLSQVGANAEASRYGTRLIGIPNANDLIVQRLLGTRGHLAAENLTISGTGTSEVGSFKLGADGSLQTLDGMSTGVSQDTFFMFDNWTPDDTSDDTPISCMNVNCSYVKVSSIYQHEIVVPGMNVVSEGGLFPLSVEHIYPCSMMEINRNDPNVGNLEGAAPITVIDQPFIVGSRYILKGKSDLDPDRPGNFGWVNLDLELGGNKNENIAAWLSGADSPPVTIPGYIPGYTGQRNAADIKAALDTLGNKYVVILIHDGHRGVGTNLEYHEIGMAIFRLENFREAGGPGEEHLEVEGDFVRRL